MKALARPGLAILLARMVAVPLVAHHGTAVSYDDSREITVTGTVTEFWWRNPHSALFIDVVDENGARVNWAIEMSSPGVLTRAIRGRCGGSRKRRRTASCSR
jgi:hypothetical protein